jgi:nucleotide-binding universal stress UspA family protein
MGRIVVGVDDSPGGRSALAFALQEAQFRHADLEVVNTWALPAAEGWNSEWPTDEAWFRKQSSDFLERVIAEGATGGDTAVQIIPVPLECDVPALGLIERSRGADLLVVGTRGRGGFKGLLLGSVSTQCVHHASCPVVVVNTPTP